MPLHIRLQFLTNVCLINAGREMISIQLMWKKYYSVTPSSHRFFYVMYLLIWIRLKKIRFMLNISPKKILDYFYGKGLNMILHKCKWGPPPLKSTLPNVTWSLPRFLYHTNHCVIWAPCLWRESSPDYFFWKCIVLFWEK